MDILTLIRSYVEGLLAAEDKFIEHLDTFPELEKTVVELTNRMAAGFLGALADSFYGALLQGKYVCSVNGAYTEKRFCHGKEARLTGGFRVIDNNAVNLMNNMTAALIAALFLLTGLV